MRFFKIGFICLCLAFLSAPLLSLALGGEWSAQSLAPDDLRAILTSILGGIICTIIIAGLGTPVALYLSRTRTSTSLVAETLVLIPMLIPALALGILLAAFYGPASTIGGIGAKFGLILTNTPAAFVLAGLYAGLPTYIFIAKSAFADVPRDYEDLAKTLGHRPINAFFSTTLPLAKKGLAVALALCWVRVLGEFGIVLILAYYPAGLPVRLWIDVQDLGIQAVFPLLVVFLIVALPIPVWLGLRARTVSE